MVTSTHTLDVPGACLHYEVRGSGPVLLLIPGGAAESGMFAGMAPLLADDHTVVTYDPRGLSRSTLDGPARDIHVETQADDAHRLLATIATEPAYVFGNSGGAVTGLALVTQHPEQVHTLIGHEPPLTELLPDRERHRAAHDDIYEAYRSHGPGVGMAKFLAHAGVDDGPAEGSGPADAEPEDTLDPDVMARIQGNFDLFLGHMLRWITTYRPDAAALRAASTRIVVAGGTDSAGQVAHRAAVALADLLGTSLVDFPGDHGGFVGQPEAFAQTLRRVLTETA